MVEPPLWAFWGVWVVLEVMAGHSSWVPPSPSSVAGSNDGHPAISPRRPLIPSTKTRRGPALGCAAVDTPLHCPWREAQAFGCSPRALTLAQETWGHTARARHGGKEASGIARGTSIRQFTTGPDLSAGFGRSALPAPNLCALFAV